MSGPTQGGSNGQGGGSDRVNPADFGPKDDLPIGQVLQRFTRQHILGDGDASNPLTRIQLDLIGNMRAQADFVPPTLMRQTGLGSDRGPGLDLEVGARYLPLHIDTSFGRYDWTEHQRLIPNGGGGYHLDASLLKLWIEQEADAALENQGWQPRRRPQAAAARAAAAQRIPAALKPALARPRQELRKAIASAARGDTSKLAKMLHGSAAEQIMARLDQAKQRREQAQARQDRALTQAATPTFIDTSAFGPDAADAPRALSLTEEAIQQLATTHPALHIDASDPNMTFEGAAQKLYQATRATARRQLRGDTPMRTVSPRDVARAPGLLASSVEQRAVQMSLRTARMFSPEPQEVAAAETAAIASSPFRNLLQNNTLNVAPIGLSAPLSASAPLFADAPAASLRAVERIASQGAGADPNATGYALSRDIDLPRFAAQAAPERPLGERSMRIARFGETSLKALSLVDPFEDEDAQGPPMTWMRSGGRGTLIEGVFGPPAAQAAPAFQPRATPPAAQAPVQQRMDLSALAASDAALRDGLVASRAQGADAASGSAYPASVGNSLQLAPSWLQPDPVVALVQARQQGQQAQRALALSDLASRVQAQDDALLRTMTPAAAQADAPVQTLMSVQSEVGRFSGYDATGAGDLADLVARAMVQSPALRAQLQTARVTRDALTQALQRAGVTSSRVASVLRDAGATADAPINSDVLTRALERAGLTSAQVPSVLDTITTLDLSAAPTGVTRDAFTRALRDAGVPASRVEALVRESGLSASGALDNTALVQALARAGMTPAQVARLSGEVADVVAQVPGLRAQLATSGATRGALAQALTRAGLPASRVDALLKEAAQGGDPASITPSNLAAVLERLEASTLTRPMRLDSAAALPSGVRETIERFAAGLNSRLDQGGDRVASAAAELLGALSTASAPGAAPQAQRSERAVRLQDVALKPGYLQALTGGIAQVQRTLGLLDRLSPQTLTGSSRPAARSGATVANQALQRVLSGLGTSGPGVQSVLQALGADMLTDTSALQRRISGDGLGWSSEDNIDQNWRLAETADQLADAIRVTYGRVAEMDEDAQRAAMRRGWGPQAVYVQGVPNTPQAQTQDYGFRRRAAAPQPAGIERLSQIAQPAAIQQRAQAAQVSANRQMRLFSPEKTLALLAPQLESGGLLDATSRGEVAQALQALSSAPAASASSAPRRVQTPFGTLTLRMENDRLIVDTEELSSNAPSISLSAQQQASAASAFAPTAPTRQVRDLTGLAQTLSSALGRTLDVQQLQRASAAPGGLAALTEATSRLVALQQQQQQQSAQRVDVTLGQPSRAERSAGVRLDPPTLRNLLQGTPLAARLEALTSADTPAGVLGPATGAQTGASIVNLPAGLGGSTLRVFANSGQAAALSAAVARATATAQPPQALVQLAQRAGALQQRIAQGDVTLSAAQQRLASVAPALAGLVQRQLSTPDLGRALERLLPEVSGGAAAEPSRLGKALERLASQREQLVQTSERIASLGDDADWSPTTANAVAALADVISDADEQRTIGALGRVGMASPAGSAMRGMSRADLAYALPFLQRSTGGWERVAAAQGPRASRAAASADPVRVALPALSGAAPSPEAVQQLLNDPVQRAAIDRAFTALPSVSGSALMELGLSLGRGADLLQSARRLGLSNSVLNTLEVLEQTPALRDRLRSGEFAGPQGFARALGALPELIQQAQQTTTARVGAVANRAESASDRGPEAGRLGQRLLSGDTLSSFDPDMRSDAAAQRRARARAMAMFPAIERILTSARPSITTAAGRALASGGFGQRRVAASAVTPTALTGALLSRFSDVEEVLDALGVPADAALQRGSSEGRSIAQAMLRRAAGAQLPSELVTPRVEVRGANTRSAIGRAFAAAERGELSFEQALAQLGGGDGAQLGMGRAGQVGIWMPGGVERLLDVGANDFVGSGSADAIRGDLIVPQMFSGTLAQTGASATSRSGAGLSPELSSRLTRLRDRALQRRSHAMASGLQTLIRTGLSGDVHVGVGNTAGAVNRASWMSHTPSHSGMERIMAMLGLSGLDDSVQATVSHGRSPERASHEQVNVGLERPQSAEAEGVAFNSSSPYGGLARTLLNRASSRTSTQVAAGTYQGKPLTTQRELFTPFTPPLPSEGTQGPQFAPRASNDGGGQGSSVSEASKPEKTNISHKLDQYLLEDTARDVLDEMLRLWNLERERRGIQ